MDERGAEAGVHFFAEAGDENLDGAGVVFVVALPDAFAEFGAGEGAAGFLEEDLEHVEFARGEGDGFAGAGDAAVADVHVEIGDLEEVGGGGIGGAAAEGFDAGDEFIHREGFREVVVGAGLETFHAVLDFAARGEDEDARSGASLTEAGEDGEAVEGGKVEIEDEKIVGVGEGGLEAEGAVVLRAERVAAAREGAGDVAGELGFVFDYEDTHGMGGDRKRAERDHGAKRPRLAGEFRGEPTGSRAAEVPQE